MLNCSRWTGAALAAALLLASTPSWAAWACPSEPNLRSTSGAQSTSITFANGKSQPIRIFWINYDGRRRFYQSVMPGDSLRFETYATHPWVVTDVAGNCLGVWFADVGASRVAIH